MNEAKTHANMIIFLLLAFSGAKVRAETGVGCRGGWVHFICENLNNSLPMSRTRIIKNTVVVKNLQQDDNGTLCSTPDRKEIKIVYCTNPDIIRTVYNKAQTTILCGRPGSDDKHGQLYFCKETGDFDCEDVLIFNTRGKYSTSPGRRGPHVTIHDITPEDQSIYWCAEHKDLYDRSYRKINITVRSDFADDQKNGPIGEDIVHSCEYPKEGQKNKFFCKGEDPHTCNHLATSSIPNPYPEKIRFNPDSEDGIIVTILNITAADEATYWFGGGNVTEHGLEIFCRLELTLDVREPEPDPQEASPCLPVVVALSVCVVVLVVVLVVLIIKGKRRNKAPQQNRQVERVYEDLQTPDRCEYSSFNKREDDCTVHTAPSGDANVDTKK